MTHKSVSIRANVSIRGVTIKAYALYIYIYIYKTGDTAEGHLEKMRTIGKKTKLKIHVSFVRFKYLNSLFLT